MTDKRDWTADIIKICAVVTAMPRWIGALLAAEGFTVPADWLGWWVIVSAIFSAGMALVEGLAFAYVFNAWRVQKDKNADRLLWFAGLSGATFVIVLAPFIAAQVRSESLNALLLADWALWIWSSAVAASTIIIVASVGYAQKRSAPQGESHKPARAPQEQTQVLAPELYLCDDCDRKFATVQALSAHKRFCARIKNIDAGRVAVETNGKH